MKGKKLTGSKNISEATAAIVKEIDWRKKSKTTVYEALVNFETYTRHNLGLREQKRLADEQVDTITPCLAKHPKPLCNSRTPILI